MHLREKLQKQYRQNCHLEPSDPEEDRNGAFLWAFRDLLAFWKDPVKRRGQQPMHWGQNELKQSIRIVGHSVDRSERNGQDGNWNHMVSALYEHEAAHSQGIDGAALNMK